MIETTDAYKIDMASDMRGETSVIIRFGIIDVDAAADAQFNANGEYYISNVQDIARYNQEYSYATAENAGYRLDGTQITQPDDANDLIYQGFISNYMSDNNGIFTQIPFVEMVFSTLHTAIGLTLTFDRVMERYPTEIKIILYKNIQSATPIKILEQIEYPTSFLHSFEFNFIDANDEQFDYIRIEFKKWFMPYQRARLGNIVYGLSLIFTGSDLKNVKLVEDIDPIMRRMTINTLDFTIIDLEKRYNADNPKGIYRFLQTKSPLTVEFAHEIIIPDKWSGFKLDKWGERKKRPWGMYYPGGYSETLKRGIYYLNSMPSVDRMEVSFSCVDKLNAIDGLYFEDTDYFPVGDMRSLHSIASAAFQASGLVYDMYVHDYYIDDSLDNFYTNAPVSGMTFKDILKLVSQAAMCIIYTDINGVIRIEPQRTQTWDYQNDFEIGFFQMLKSPKIEPSPELYKIKGKYYNYALDNNELRSEEFVVDDMPIINNTGYFETLENPLITDISWWKNVANWIVNHHKNRNTYYFDYRGDPAMESNDKILIASEFSVENGNRKTNIPSTVLKHEINFAGSLRGSAIVKRIEVI